ncbi:MAG: winged helix-turn-helix domain-containing protein [Planctomycetota bacterium]|nr:winged helix-turn-helix domain-containing protein [Planctomycetota bacterium]
MPIPEIRVKTNLLDYPFRESMGWLAKEEKIVIYGDPNTGYASLSGC